MQKITPDDYAKLHYAYNEDTDLEIIADLLDEEHEAGYLVWLYWPRMIARAKAAKSFGWFQMTPRKLADSVRDRSPWNVRHRLWDLLIEYGLIVLRQDAIESQSAKVDVLLVEWENWQSMTKRESKFLQREREKFAAGEGVHWTVSQRAEFVLGVSSDDLRDAVCRQRGVAVVGNVSTDPPNVSIDHPGVAIRDETRRDETKVGRVRPLPTSVRQTIETVRNIPGLSAFSLTSNVVKAMEQYPSLSDEAICEAITAFEALIPEGTTMRPEKSWRKLRNCFEVARKRMDEDAARTAAAAAPVKRRTGAELLAEQAAIWGESA